MFPALADALGIARPLFGLETPLQETQTLLWLVFLLALGVGISYVVLLIWTLSKHISHEPLARTRPAGPRTPPPPGHH